MAQTQPTATERVLAALDEQARVPFDRAWPVAIRDLDDREKRQVHSHKNTFREYHDLGQWNISVRRELRSTRRARRAHVRAWRRPQVHE